MNNALVSRLVTVLAVACAGCCTDPVNNERFLCLSPMSEAQEIALGQEATPSFIAESGGVYPDAGLSQDMGRIVLDMAHKSHRPQLPWQFTVLNTSEINAFALPGGSVFVTRGLLAQVESEAQFAHLMGHELGHVAHRHAVRGQNRAVLAAVLTGAATILDQQMAEGPDDLPLFTTLTGVGGQLVLMRYSRNQELQSDERGVDYALMAGYDPREGKKTFQMFQQMRAASGQQAGLLDELLSTHPLDARRIDNIDAYVTQRHPEVAGDRSLVVSGDTWQRRHQQLRTEQVVYEKHDRALALIAQAREENRPQLLDQAEETLRECARALPQHAPFPLALGMVALERRDDAGASRALDRACQLDPQLFGARFYRGLSHARAGRPDQARADLTAAHGLYPASPYPCYHLAQTYEQLGEPAGATRWYEETLQRSTPQSSLQAHARERLASLKAVP